VTELQLDLFGEVEAQAAADEAAAAERTARVATRARLRAEWEQIVQSWPDGTPVTWTAPWDCADGTPRGATVPAFRCPCCGGVEVNEFLLDNNHWTGAEDYIRRALSGEGQRTHCCRLELLDSQATSLWSRTVCRARICSRCGRPNTHPDRVWTRISGDHDGAEHCDCGCHEHTECDTPDRCIPLILAIAETYREHAEAHHIPRARWQCGHHLAVSGVAVKVVSVSYPPTPEHSVRYTAKSSTGEVVWDETWNRTRKKWTTMVDVTRDRAR